VASHLVEGGHDRVTGLAGRRGVRERRVHARGGDHDALEVGVLAGQSLGVAQELDCGVDVALVGVGHGYAPVFGVVRAASARRSLEASSSGGVSRNRVMICAWRACSYWLTPHVIASSAHRNDQFQAVQSHS
jgi:hypothetical protein